MARAWSFLTLNDSARQYVGNEGYADQLETHYTFDSTVPNHRSVSVGDLAVLRDTAVVLGVGWIDVIESAHERKYRLRCPTCSRTGFKHRRGLTPAFRCSSCGGVFDDPDREELDVVQFVARYSRTFAPADAVVPAVELGPAYHSRAAQHAIRELELDRVREILADAIGARPAYWDVCAGVRPELSGGFGQRMGRYRFGQQRFRELLLARFGASCAFTGPQPAAALDAAHLYRYCDNPVHETDAGLLLRRDLHGLFDRWLITIDPREFRIRVAPRLRQYPHLAELDGAPLRLASDLRPSADHLVVHFELAVAGW